MDQGRWEDFTQNVGWGVLHTAHCVLVHVCVCVHACACMCVCVCVCLCVYSPPPSLFMHLCSIQHFIIIVHQSHLIMYAIQSRDNNFQRNVFHTHHFQCNVFYCHNLRCKPCHSSE